MFINWILNKILELYRCESPFKLYVAYCFSPLEDISQIFEEFLDAPHKRVKRREKTLTGVCLLLKQ